MKKRKNQLLYRSMADKDDTRWSYAAGLDEMCSPGCYLLQLRHNCPGTTLPLPACDEEHYITATLIITEIGTDDQLQRNRLIGQTLIMPDCNDGRTRIFNRTLKKGNSNRTWNNWNNIAQSSMDDEITNTEDLIASVTELKSQTKEIKTDLSSETARTKEAEAAITEDAILSGSMNINPSTDSVTLSYRNIDGTEVSEIDIPTATTEKAGVMSAQDRINLSKAGNTFKFEKSYANEMMESSNRFVANQIKGNFGNTIRFDCSNANQTLTALFYEGDTYKSIDIPPYQSLVRTFNSETGFTKISIYFLPGVVVNGCLKVKVSGGVYNVIETNLANTNHKINCNYNLLATQYEGEQESIITLGDVSDQLVGAGAVYSSQNSREILELKDEDNVIKQRSFTIPISPYGLKAGDTLDIACDFISDFANKCRLLIVSRYNDTNKGDIKYVDVIPYNKVVRAHLEYTITEGSNKIFIELSRQQKMYSKNDVLISNLVLTKNKYNANYNKVVKNVAPEYFMYSSINTRTFANAEHSVFINEQLNITNNEAYSFKKLFPLNKLGLVEGDSFKMHITQGGNCKSTLRLLKKNGDGSTSILTADGGYNGFFNDTIVLSDSAYVEIVLYLKAAGTASFSEIYLLKSGYSVENLKYSIPTVHTLRDALTFNIPILDIGGITYRSIKDNPKSITDYVTGNRVCKAGFGSVKKIKDEILDDSTIVKRLMACDGSYTYWGEQIADSDPQMVPIASYNAEQGFKLYRCKGADVDDLEVVAELNQPITGVIVYDDRILCCLAPASISNVPNNARIVSIIGDIVVDKLVFPSIAYLPFQAWGAFKRYGDYIYMPCYGLKESTNYANAKGGDKLWLSRDRGETWEIVFDLAEHTDVIPSELLPNIHIHGGCMCEDNGRMYITHGDAQSGIFWSDDEGNSWNYRIGTEDKCGPKLQMCAIEAMNNNIVCGTDMSPSGIMMIRDYHGVPRLDEGYQLTPNGVYSLSYVPSNILSLPNGLTLIPCGNWQGSDKTNKLLATYDGVRFYEIFDEGILCDAKVYKMPRVLQYESGKFIFDFESMQGGVRRYCIYMISL